MNVPYCESSLRASPQVPTAPFTQIHGVKFFNNPSACISHFERFPWMSRIISLFNSFKTLFIYCCRNKLDLILSRMVTENQIQLLTGSESQPLSKRRLVVCIHGLNNNPAQFNKIIGEMRKKDLSDTDIFAPHVVEKGNAKLDEMVKPIFEKIVEWSTTPSDNKELVLIGISNGGRIARAVETALALESTSNINSIKKVHFISIVGACKGSSLVNFVHRIGLSGLSGLSWFISRNIAEEMATDSLRNQRLDREWTDGLSNQWTRQYTFFASPHDWQVTNYTSSLMDVDSQNVRYAIVPGHGHNSIVHAVAPVVAEIVFT